MYCTPSFSRQRTSSSAADWVGAFEGEAVAIFSGAAMSPGAGMGFPTRGGSEQCSRSIDIGFGHGVAPREDVEVAAFVRLRHVLGEDRAVAARVARRRRLPVFLPARELFVRHQ